MELFIVTFILLQDINTCRYKRTHLGVKKRGVGEKDKKKKTKPERDTSDRGNTQKLNQKPGPN